MSIHVKSLCCNIRVFMWIWLNFHLQNKVVQIFWVSVNILALITSGLVYVSLLHCEEIGGEGLLWVECGIWPWERWAVLTISSLLRSLHWKVTDMSAPLVQAGYWNFTKIDKAVWCLFSQNIFLVYKQNTVHRILHLLYGWGRLWINYKSKLWNFRQSWITGIWMLV